MSIQKIIQESINGNPLEMKEALAEELRNRIALALEAKMSDEEDDDNGGDSSDEDNDDEDMKKEEFEQIDEISDDLRKRYLKKSEKDSDKLMDKYLDSEPDSDESWAIHDKMQNRWAGQERAKRKMKKEEVEQIDELKKSTLASYVSKAADNAAMHGIKYGEKKAQSDEMDRMMNRHMSYADKDKVRQIMKTTSSDVDAPREKAAKRLKGIDLAVKKLSK